MYHRPATQDDAIYTYQLRDPPKFDEKSPTVLSPLAVPVPTWDDPSAVPTNPAINYGDEYISAHVSQAQVPYLRWWMWDILAALLGAATLAAIAGVLSAYDGKPQDSWPSDVLTINGLMAILTTICKGAFMTSVASAISQAKWNRMSRSGRKLADFATLDDASRGTFGSLKLFLKLWPVHIAYLGALITVLSLGFDTFLQQLISLRIDLVPGGPDSPIGDVASSTYVNTAVGFGSGWRLSAASRLAVYEGFMANTIDHPAATCPTGNCTWPIVPTVGVCGACMDLTDKIEFNRSSSSSSGLCNVSLGKLQLKGVYCSGDFLDFMQVFTMGAGPGRIFDTLADQNVQATSPHVIANFAGLGLSESKSLKTGMNDSRATECALWYCVQAHNVSVQLGELQDTTLKTWSKVENTSPGASNGNITFVDIPADMNASPADKFAVSYYQMLAMTAYAPKTFVGNASADANLNVTSTTSDFADGLYRNLDDVGPWIERVARSMSNEIRLNTTAGRPSEARYRGTAFEGKAIIEITWGWIAFPATLVFLSIVYLIYEIVHTYGLNVRVWKADPLVSLYTDLGSELKPIAGLGTNEPGGIKRRIGDRRLRLDMREGRLVGFVQED